MALLNSIEQLRAIDWGRTYHWDIKFQGTPSPFTEFFPAREVSEPIFGVEDFSFALGVSEFFVPKSGLSEKIGISFYDDIRFSLEQWLVDWIDQILPIGGGVAPIESICRDVEIHKLTPSHELLRKNIYTVYPSGSVESSWDSTSGAKLLHVNFNVVGKKK